MVNKLIDLTFKKTKLMINKFNQINLNFINFMIQDRFLLIQTICIIRQNLDFSLHVINFCIYILKLV